MLHTNICSLQNTFYKLEVFLNNLKYEFDIVTLTETRHEENNVTFKPGLLWGYQKYKGIPGSSKKEGLVFMLKIPFHNNDGFEQNS